MATLFWQAFQRIFCVVRSSNSTLRQHISTMLAACPHELASCRRRLIWRSAVSKARLIATFPRFHTGLLHPTCWCAGLQARLQPMVSLFCYRESLPSEIVHFRSKALTVWNGFPDELITSLQTTADCRRHNFLSSVKIKRFCFARLIQTVDARGDLIVIAVGPISH